MMEKTTTGVRARQATRGVRRGLRLIVDVVTLDFDNAFERLFPNASDRAIMDVMEALEWLEQYAEDEL